jgi:hypothetical protein
VLGIGARAVCSAGLAATRHEPIAEGASSDTARRAALVGALARLVSGLRPGVPPRRVSVRVMVGAALTRLWTLKVPDGVATLAELELVAQARCGQLFGTACEWHVAADWQPARPFLCTATPAWLLQGVQDVFGAGQRVATVVPSVLAMQASQPPTDGWTCVTSPASTALLAWQHGHIVQARTLPWRKVDGDADAQRAHASQELRREALRLQMSDSAAVSWHDLPAIATAGRSLDTPCPDAWAAAQLAHALAVRGRDPKVRP